MTKKSSARILHDRARRLFIRYQEDLRRAGLDAELAIRDPVAVMRLPVVRVLWKDASTQPGPVHRDDFEHGIVLDIVGFLARETDEVLTLAMEYDPKELFHRHVVHIPKANVITRTVLATP